MKEPFTSVPAKYCRTLYNGNGISINIVRTANDELLPDAIIAKGKSRGGYYFTVIGTDLPSDPSFTFRYTGTWEINKKYGLQFRAVSAVAIPPDTAKGLIRYLSGKRFEGIGRKTAEAIVREFGPDTMTVLKTNPEKLLQIKGITLKRMESIRQTMAEMDSYSDLAVLLGQYDVRQDRIAAAVKILGVDAVDQVKADPYCLLKVKGIGFPTADRIACDLQVMLKSQERLISAMLYVLKTDSVRCGNVYTDGGQLKTLTLRLLNSAPGGPAVSECDYDAAFSEAVKNGDLVIRGTDCVFSEENERLEHDPAVKVCQLLANPLPQKLLDERNKLAAQSVSSGEVMLSQKQKEAALTVLSRRTTVLTGGPGTGKTTVLRYIIKLFTHSHEPGASNVTLLAPTGKAARRMSEATGWPASTIHREIHLYGDTVSCGETVSLPEGLVIVDESSMLDQFVFSRLMACIRSCRYQLVFVGDPNQLPSIGAGAVLSELMNSGAVPVARLTEVFRQTSDASGIGDNARRIISGDTALEQSDSFRIVIHPDEADLQKQIISTYLKLSADFGNDEVVVLTPVRHKGQLCVDALNKALQDAVNPKGSGCHSLVCNGTEFRENDRVMQMKNNEFASNGETGVVEKIIDSRNEDDEAEKTVIIRFSSGTVEYSKEDMEDVDLAYATTVHKSQGSEYKAVIMVMLSQYQFAEKRCLFYTAATRAKECFIVFTDSRYTVARTIRLTGAERRNTLLAARLKAYYGKAEGKSQ